MHRFSGNSAARLIGLGLCVATLPALTFSAAGDDVFDSGAITFGLDYRYPLTGDYRSIYVGQVMLEMLSAGHHGLAWSLGAGGVHLKRGTEAFAVAHDPVILETALHYHLYFTPSEATWRPYGSFKLGLNTLHWDYRNPIYSGGDRVGWDSLLGFDAYVGVGLSVNLTSGLQCFAEMGYGGIGYGDTTTREKKNEFFDSFGYVAIKGGVGWRF